MENVALKENFGTLSETVAALAKLGYTLDFNIREECIVCHQMNMVLSADEFQIDKVYRFEGASDPDDQSIVYAISSPKNNAKGILVNGYGVSADPISATLVAKLRTNLPPAITQNKTNDEMPPRAADDSKLNAGLVEMDLPRLISQLKNEKAWTEGDRAALTIFKSDKMRIVLMGLHKQAALKPHQAKGVISVQVLEGKMSFATSQQTVVMEKGQMIALHENITHSVSALEETFFLLTLAVG